MNCILIFGMCFFLGTEHFSSQWLISSKDWKESQTTSRQTLNSAMETLPKDWETLKHQSSHPSQVQERAIEMIFLVFSIIALRQKNVRLNAIQSEAAVVETDFATKCIVDA